MLVDFGNILFCWAVCVSIFGVHAFDGTNGCLNSSSSGYFHAFELLPQSSKHTQGCATADSVLETPKVYQENHVVYVQNDRAADIYLNVHGIHHRTRNSLPHYEEYRYEFALLSQKDVIWALSTENMPNSSVSYKFYLSYGSQIISREGLKISVAFSELRLEGVTSAALLSLCKTSGVFAGQRVTSFSEVDVSRIAAVNISVGPKKDTEQTWHGNFTPCGNVESEYLSPTVSASQYRQNQPVSACERKHSMKEEHYRRQAFVLDLKFPHEKSPHRMPVINLEVSGKEVARNGVLKPVVVLRSNVGTLWRLRVAENLKPDGFLLVMDKKGQVVNAKGSPDLDTSSENLDYDENDSTALTRSIATLYECTITTFAQYESPTDLVFLRISGDEQGTELPDSSNFRDPADIALSIYSQSTGRCENLRWSFSIPLSSLTEYGLSVRNIDVGSKNGLCKHELTEEDVTYNLRECAVVVEEYYEAELKIKFTSSLSRGHLFSIPDKNLRNETIPMQCGIESQPSVEFDDYSTNGRDLESGIQTVCMDNVFTVKIPKSNQEYFDLAGVAECRMPDSGGYAEYVFKQNEKETCGAVIANGICKVEIPIAAEDGNGDPQFIKLSCRDSARKISTKYQLKVFKDFSLKNELAADDTIFLERNGRAPTYHVQVSVSSNDPLLTVHLATCSLELDSRNVFTLVSRNCPAHSGVSFVRSFSPMMNQTQHFAVEMGRFLHGGDDVVITCEVDACMASSDDSCVPTVPECFHLHGDGCTEKSNQNSYPLAPFHPETVSSGVLRFSTASIKGDPTHELLGERDENKEDKPNSISVPIAVILAMGGFTLGCFFIIMIWRIECCIKNQKTPSKTSAESESESGGESGGSRSTGSTKTSGSSFSALFCLRTEKSSPPASSKDDLQMELNPLIKRPTSVAPPTNEVRSKQKNPETDSNMKQTELKYDDHHLYVSGDNVTPFLGLNIVRIPAEAPIKLHTENLTAAPPNESIPALTSSDTTVKAPHTGSLPTCHTSPDHVRVKDGAPTPHETQRTSRETGDLRHGGGQQTRPVYNSDWHICQQVTKDEFARLKEVAL